MDARMTTDREPDLLKGAVAGLVGGLAGTWAMSEYQALWSRVVDGHEPQSAGGRHDARDWQEKNEDQNANELAAQAVARHTIGRTLTERELEVGAPLMHYAFGTALGLMYGLAAERTTWATSGSGLGFGSAVWAGADEIAMPAIGWSRPQRYPLESHLQSLTAHFVFGVTTEMVRRGARRLMGNGRFTSSSGSHRSRF
jgi:putative membrane protein